MPNDDIAAQVPDNLKRNLDWYIEHQRELSAQYSGKVLLIFNQELIGVFTGMNEAWDSALEKYPPGTFTLQVCSPEPDSYTLMLFSPGFSVV
jgi:hypothetical protein